MNIIARFKDNRRTFHAKLCEIERTIKCEFGRIQTVTEIVGGDQYEGEYVVTPHVGEQELQTKNKVLLDDVTIKAIPYFETSNTSGGNTVYIGNEV